MTQTAVEISLRDRQVLRDLARRVRDIATSAEMHTLRQSWRRHNALRGERPMVVVCPEGSWGELVTADDLTCSSEAACRIEWQLRSRIYQHDVIGDDTPQEPTYTVPWHIKIGNYGVDIPYVHGDNRGSYAWDPPLKSLDDLHRLHPRPLSVDRAGTQRQAAALHELFGDLLDIQIKCQSWWTTGLTWDAALLFGMEPMMLAMYDEPEKLHGLMAFLRDDMMRLLDFVETERLATANDGSDYVGSGGFGLLDDLRHTPEHEPAQLSDRWGFAESQETVGISPSMFEEFVLPYQVPLLERFGINCYGCCEGLEHRIGHVLRQVPRLRRVSVAPMAHQEQMAAALGGGYIYSRKPNPAHLCVGFNEDALRADVRRTLACAGDQPLELIMKDTHTVEHDRSRMQRWVALARDEIARHYG